MSSSFVNSPLDIHFKRFTPCVIIYHCDKWLSQQAILTLKDTRIHVGSSNNCNKPPYIETSVNKTFSLTSALNIPDVNPNNWYIRLRWNFDNTQFWCENNIVKDLILFDDTFNITWCKTFFRWVMREVGNAYDFQIELWLG